MADETKPASKPETAPPTGWKKFRTDWDRSFDRTKAATTILGSAAFFVGLVASDDDRFRAGLVLAALVAVLYVLIEFITLLFRQVPARFGWKRKAAIGAAAVLMAVPYSLLAWPVAKTEIFCEPPLIAETDTRKSQPRVQDTVELFLPSITREHFDVVWRISSGIGRILKSDGPHVSYQPRAPGVHLIEATVTNTCGRSSQVVLSVTVKPR